MEQGAQFADGVGRVEVDAQIDVGKRIRLGHHQRGRALVVVPDLASGIATGLQAGHQAVLHRITRRRLERIGHRFDHPFALEEFPVAM